MTKALQEIGFSKAAKFGVLTILMELYKFLLFPQLRLPFLRLLGAEIGANTIIHPVSFFNLYRVGFSGLSIGENCFMGDGCLVDLAETVTLEHDVTLAERVTILTHRNVGYETHPLQGAFPPEAKGVTIRAGSFVGANVTILPGVEVAERSFIAAGSVVTEDVPPMTLVAGVPAKKVRKIDNNDLN